MTEPTAMLSVLLTTAIGGAWDYKTGNIPNWLTFPFILGGVALQLISRGWPGLIVSGLGTLFCGLVPFLLFRQEAMGGGDVKLLVGIGIWLGYTAGLEVQLLACIFAALYACIKLLWLGHFSQMIKNTGWLIVNIFLPKSKKRPINPTELTSIRFGLPIFLSALCITVWTHVRWIMPL